MDGKLCPYCMQVSFGDFCPRCKKPIAYQGKPMQLPVGTRLKGYHSYVVGAALGQGGFGVTYLALDTDAGRRVALKEFFPVHCSGRTQSTTVMAYDGQQADFEKGKQRFLLEAQTMQRLSGIRSTVDVYDCFQANNTVYLVMEYVEGKSLKQYLQETGPMEPQACFALFRPLMEDLAVIHRQGLIHRDIAPDNIILAPDGKLRIIDFGTAREYMGEASLTVVVKKGFAPLEQYTRKGQSGATDVYALAATLYYCITGHLPPDSMDRISRDPLVPPSQWGVKVTAQQERALLHALGVMTENRTQNMEQFLWELNSGGTPGGKEKQIRIPPQPPKKGNPWILPAAAAAMLCAAVVLIAVLVKAGGSREPVMAAPGTTVITEAPTETAKPTETAAPTETTAPETTSPPETTKPVPHYSVGDIVKFGSYEQNNDRSCTEPIEWIVLETSGTRTKLLSRYVLDYQRFHGSWDASITWQDCELRQWLNNAFIDAAFSDEEWDRLMKVTVPAGKNPIYATNAGSDTQDKVTVLSISEAETYFSSDAARQVEATAYALTKVKLKDNLKGSYAWWRLRSPGYCGGSATSVYLGGQIAYRGDAINDDDCGIRPVIWVDWA